MKNYSEPLDCLALPPDKGLLMHKYSLFLERGGHPYIGSTCTTVLPDISVYVKPTQ